MPVRGGNVRALLKGEMFPLIGPLKEVVGKISGLFPAIQWEEIKEVPAYGLTARVAVGRLESMEFHLVLEKNDDVSTIATLNGVATHVKKVQKELGLASLGNQMNQLDDV